MKKEIKEVNMAHWIIDDKGFDGVLYECSNCGHSWNDYYCNFSKDICESCGAHIGDEDEYVEETKKIADNTKQLPVVSIPDLIEWLSGEKYADVDENSIDMTEKYEKQHLWELSRNCFINQVIRHLEEFM